MEVAGLFSGHADVAGGRRWTRALQVLIVAAACTTEAPGGTKPEPPKASEQTGPIGADTPGCRWGSAVKDEVNNEWMWFGGVGGVAPGALGTWIFKDGAWRRAEFGDEKQRALHARAAELSRDVRRLHAAVANRYYGSESEKARAAKLDTVCMGPVAAVYQLESGELGSDAKSKLATLLNVLTGKLTAADVAAAREAWLAVVRVEWALSPEPSPRCNAAMAFDAETKSIVMFGGEGEFGAYNDTWVYDCVTRAWRMARPSCAPSPRCGHGMAAYKGKVYVVGGFEPRGSMDYCAALWARLPCDVWEFDIKGGKWTLLKAGEGKTAPTGYQPSVQARISADGKELAWTADILSYGKKTGEVTGTFALPGSDAGTDKAGVAPGTLKVRGMGFDPAWYERVPPADPDAVAKKLADLPANKWVDMQPPVRHVNRDWGTTVLDLDRDQLLHWSGGHSSHCGTDVAHYSLATNRWHILYTPELPFEYCYSNDGAPVPTMSGRPWGPHSYLSYAWDEVTGKMVWTGTHGAYRAANPCGVFTYDPERYEWSSEQWKTEGGWFHAERHKTCMVRTPRGIAVWADKYTGSGNRSGLWMADVAARLFRPVAGTDPKDSTTFPPPVFGDRHGMTYDSKRDRTLMFHFGIKDKHKVWACDLKTGQVTVHEPKGSDKFPADVSIGREATYVPDEDAVIICTAGQPAQRTLVYDCAADEWLEMPTPCVKSARGETPGYGVSTGIEWDPKRKLLWLVQTDGSVYAMRFERKTAALGPLK